MDVSGAVLFGIIAMVAYGLGDAIAKKPIQQIGVQQTIFVRGMVISLIYIIALLVYPFEMSFHWSSFLLSIFLAILGYLPLITFYKAIEMENIGIVSTIAHASVIITILLSLVVYKEKLTTITLIALGLLCCGILLISTHHTKQVNNGNNAKKYPGTFTYSKGIFFAAITALLWGVIWFLMRIPTQLQGAMLTSFILEGGITLCSFFYLLKKQQLTLKIPGSLWRTLFIVGLLASIGTLTLMLGVRYFPTSVVVAIAFANPLVAALYGRVVYKEKLNLVQYAAILLIVSSIVVISLF
ncbi:DMT family transporter [Candidatus Woesearchaeota archaeon]|nr:DMT family transporter [Candidatus Woesearchaeota archaeon]